MKIWEILKEIEYTASTACDNTEIEILTSSADQAVRGCLLFDLPYAMSNKAREHKIKNLPAAVVTQYPENFTKYKCPIITVQNARAAYSAAYSNFMRIDYSKIKFAGITGTNGKSSTAIMLFEILKHASHKVGFIGTGRIIIGDKTVSDSKYSMTTPDPEILYPLIAKMQSEGVDIIVIEVSAHALSLDKLTPINFDISVFTGLSPEHMDFYTDMQDYLAAKERLIRKSKKTIVNQDDKYGRELLARNGALCNSAGIIFGGDFYVTDINRLGFSGSEYLFRTKDFITKLKINLCADCNIYNSMLATSAAVSLGVAPRHCKEALLNLSHIDGRFEIFDGEVMVIKDYAHTPHALENLLKCVNSCKKAGQNVTIVFGCGGERDAKKRPLMAAVASKLAFRVIICEDNSRGENPIEIITDILLGTDALNIGVIADRRLAIEYAIKSSAPSDIVVVSGKGHEKYICDKFGLHEFDESQIILNAQASRGKKKEDEN